MQVVYSAVVAGFLNLLIIPLVLFVAHKMEWFDAPDERKIHVHKVPRLGGIGVFWSAVLAYLLTMLFGFGPETSFDVVARYWPVFVGAFVIHGIGLADDFLDLSAKLKFVVQLAVAILLVSTGFLFKSIWIPFADVNLDLGYFGYALSVIWIVGIINAVNLIDGMDGLCASISGVIILVMAVLLMGNGQEIPALLAFVLAGSIVGYIFFNFPPASIFMGDSGSTFLGFMVAVLPLMDQSGKSGGMWIWQAALMVSIPVFDTFASMIRRKRQGVSIATPDKWHLHHKLLKLGFNARGILNIIIPVMLILGAVVVLCRGMGSQVYGLIVLGFMGLVIAAFLVLHYLKERQIRQNDEKA